MKNNGKIRNNFVKESLLDYNNLADTLKENTESAVKNLLKETVLEQYAKILTEDEDEEYDVEEVDDTDSEMTDTDSDAATDSAEGMDSEGVEDETGEVSDGGTEETETETEDSEALEDDNEEGWSEFDKYQVSDGEYDFSNAEDEEIVKVYKLLKDDDQVVVTKSDDKVNIKDNETGAEYLIDLGGEDTLEEDSDDVEFEVETDEFENEEGDNMNESRIFEIALNEYNSNVGYTDNYQSKDVMTNPGMSEPGKNVNDWDAGVPKGTKKPWSGKKNNKSENQPYTAGKGKTVEEEDNMEELQEAGIHRGGRVQQNSTAKSWNDNSPSSRNSRNMSKGGKKVTSTSQAPYSTIEDEATNEAIRAKAGKIFAENRQLKAALSKFRNTLQEAAITNVNLGNIIKLVMENTTSTDEKKEIIARFGNESHSIEQSKNLYESISRDLKKKTKMDINESKEFTVNDNKLINETQIYRSNDLLESLDLMHKICK